MKNTTLIIFLFLANLAVQVQTTSTLLGKWLVCTSFEFNASETCSKNQYVTYLFHADGTYSDSRQYIINGKKYDYHGEWQLNGDTLSIDATDENGMSIPVQKFEIIWINEALFYTLGTEGPGGPLVYTYFRKQA